MSLDDLPTDQQEKRIGQFARILGQDVEIYYPIANRREANQIMYELLRQIKARAARRAAQKISKQIVTRRENDQQRNIDE